MNHQTLKLFFLVIEQNFFEMTEKRYVILVRLSENIAINMVTVSFNTTVRQMTQMSPQKTD